MNVATERDSTALRTALDAELDRILAAVPPGPAPRRPDRTVSASPLCLCWPDETDE
ncbi:hypothetical protein [Kineococcus sp. NPDC059986]|uniref:hypothetical protein n=1 Tax=Kineococcus sp. NPDC059986 TaxID=3155538 RepID=UPI00344D949A